MMELFKTWFGFEKRVNRKMYLLSGIGLMLLKYAGDALLVWISQKQVLDPLTFLRPLRSGKFESVLWALPFAWIGVSMSIRRAVDAGYSPWTGFFFFVPFLNFLLMGFLSLAPTQIAEAWSVQPFALQVRSRVSSAAMGVVLAALYAMAMMLLVIFGYRDYGSGLFMGTPAIMGAITAYLYNHGSRRGLMETLGVVSVSVFIVGGLFLLFALEGVICLAMAFPIGLGMAWIGGLVGWQLAAHWAGSTKQSFWVLLIVPALATVEKISRPESPLYEVVSSVEIAAPPETVWKRVIAFPRLAPPTDWLFRAGVAYPIAARIEGEGVGAIRHCQFSTGDFVEPITHWEPGKRLAFDVSFFPAPMKELSFYENVYAPHLEGYFAARRGEFRIVELGNGRTRLEGSTWYRLEIYPVTYWRWYADTIVARIHARVLAQVKRVAESDT